MHILKVLNLFDSPVYYIKTVSSTMDISKELASKDEPNGTVVVSEFQEKGRGRGLNRIWQAKKGESLLFTILLRFPCIEDIPVALTLRVGLAVAEGIEEFVPSLKDEVKIKWPNDILLLNHREHKEHRGYNGKVAGILCEADEGVVHVGIGINILQKEFPIELKDKATSLTLASDNEIKSEQKNELLKLILKNIYNNLTTNHTNKNNWKSSIEKRLYKIGEEVTFIEGSPDSGKEIKGILTGITDKGELLIDNIEYITGELILY